MYRLLGGLKDYFKVQDIKTDNAVFRLHNLFTTAILLTCSMIITATQFVGNPIQCIVNGIPVHVVNTFCWVTSTFTMPDAHKRQVKHLNQSMINSGHIPHPGIGPSREDEEIIRHAYYQWVPFVLFLQALMFYLPHYVWKQAEGGRMKAFVNALQVVALSEYAEDDVQLGNRSIPSKNKTKGVMISARKNFLARVHLMRPWSVWLVCCELANAVNVVLQFLVTDVFLSGTFRNLGSRVASQSMDEMDYLDIAFPKVTKCDFYKFGPSGSIQRHDALCVMALNIINEKIFTFLWYWYIILSICTIFGLIYRLMAFVMHARSSWFNRYLFQYAAPSSKDYWSMIELTKQMHFSDWLFLYYFAKNVESFVFRDFFLDLAREMDERKKPHEHEEELLPL
ncbi:innexin inx1-like [Ctenocephalides felis]|uniref:innexin inx1-like n=1 Tax=Ctenocephalides felis TaxID=7515 RepID=UPI000E6E1214|nr:innexin inx1-like [Ctenocephalides felis]